MLPLILALLLIFSLITLTNVAAASSSDQLRRAVNWLLLLFNLPVFVFGLAYLLMSPEQLEAANVGLALTSFRPAGIVLVLTAIWGLLATLPEVRRLLARWIPLDPQSPVHTLALILAGYLVSQSLLNLSQGGLEGMVETTDAASIGQVVASEVLYAAVALAGVGLFIRRDSLKVLDRLGLEWPKLPQLARSVRWIVALLVLQWVVGALFLLADPEQAEVLDNLNTMLLGNMDTVWEWFVLALAAAVGEEILFRGALQPVFGLWLTAFVFAFAHVQYGFTPATALVFFIGLILGLVRQRSNTTVAIFVHFSYNFLLGLLALLAPYLESLVSQ